MPEPEKSRPSIAHFRGKTPPGFDKDGIAYTTDLVNEQSSEGSDAYEPGEDNNVNI